LKINTAIFAVRLAAMPAGASVITQVASRAALNPDDSVSWGVATDEGNSPASPYARTSNGGLSVTALHAGDFLILVQGSGFAGNFTDGDVVLNSNFLDGPVNILFGSAVRGLGLQIQRDELGPFTATMTAFGAGNVNFGSVSVTGTTTFSAPGDNSAPFLGLMGSAKDIVAIQVSVSHSGGVAGDTVDFTDLSLVTAAVPEPATAALILAGSLLAIWKKRR
jgi:hypothetical protein